MTTRDIQHQASSARSTGKSGKTGDSVGRHLNSIEELREAVNACRRCHLWKDATQGVPGEGPAPSEIMLVGEQPGDMEDREGLPFVGPAGALLNRALDEAGIDRKSVYVSNAVKHFKWEPRGKRRLHVKPNVGEIQACKWWLTEELKFVAPKIVIALGASAARSVLGRSVTVSAMRGAPAPLEGSVHAWVTIHPSYLLRIQDDADQRAEYTRFVEDLKGAKAWARRQT